MKFKSLKLTFFMLIVLLPTTLASCFDFSGFLEVETGFVISFDNQGHGSEPEDIVDAYKIPSELPILTDDDYIFGGWYYDSSCTTIVVASMPILSDITLYAKWTKVETFYVSFNINGHGNSVKQVNDVNQIPTLPILEEEGYEFGGWYYDINCTRVAEENETITANTTLYAKWTIMSYDVKFDSLRGSSVNSVTVEYNSLLSKPTDPTKQGYEFDGWYKDTDFTTEWNFETDRVKSDLTLYAKWVQNEFTVEFDTDNGSLIENQKITLNGLVIMPTNPTKSGYTFGGWYKDVALTIEWNFETDTISSNTTLYAKWVPNVDVEENKYIIQFNTLNHGITPDYIVNVTAIPDNLPVLTEAGYIFGGWYYDSSCVITACAGETISSNTTLYAKWTRITYSVIFNVQGHGTAPAVISGVAEIPENLPVLEVDGYEFGGWYYDSSCTNIAESGDSLSANTTLYAKWTEQEVEISTEFQVHFLELGIKYVGDCVYIKAGGVDILIDAGSRKSSGKTIINYIDQYCTDGILEYVIVTHGHQDHIAAFVDNSSSEPGIFSHYEVEVIIDFPKYNTSSQISKDYFTARAAEVAAGAKHYTALDCIKGTNGGQKVFNITDDISFEILEQKYYYTSTTNENDYSVCTLFRHGEEYFLFTGDLELAGEQSLVALNDLPKVKVFKGGHHGSGTSSNDCLLSVIQPEIVCICTCAGSDEYTKNLDNMFPYQEVINRLAKYTDKIYVTSVAIYTVGTYNGTEYLETTGFTSLNGNIVVTSSASGVTVNCSNSNKVLKESDWFNTEVTLNGTTRTIRTWPSYGK